MKVVLIAQVTRSGSRERGFLGSPPPLIYSSSYPRKLFFEGSPNLLPPVPCIRGSHPLFRLLTFSLFLIVKYLALLCYLPPISPSYHLFRTPTFRPFLSRLLYFSHLLFSRAPTPLSSPISLINLNFNFKLEGARPPIKILDPPTGTLITL